MILSRFLVRKAGSYQVETGLDYIRTSLRCKTFQVTEPTLSGGFFVNQAMTETSSPSPSVWRFSGFTYPNYTSVPDQLFDELMARLSGAELKVLLYIIRRTFGFKRSSDDISLSQMVKGIKKKNGEILDTGTGLGKASVARALNSLEQKKIILRRRRSSGKNGNEATTYALNIVSSRPVSQNETPLVSKRDTSLSHQRDTQQTVLQQTARQQQQKVGKTLRNTGGGNHNELAAVLIDKGIDKTVAYRLVTSYNQQQIEDNLDWFEWKLTTAPNSIKTNPAGLLRRAIEQNYASEGHHQGFQTRQQKAALAVAQKQQLQQQQKLVEAHKRKQEASIQQKEKARLKRLERLRERYQTETGELKLWQRVLHRLKKKLSAVTFNTYLAQTALLSVRDGQALIAVPNRFIKKRVEVELDPLIQAILTDQLNDQNVLIQWITLDEFSDE